KEGKLVENKERSGLVKQLFASVEAGDGLHVIAGRLNKAKVPTWGGAKSWSKTQLRNIIVGRHVLGEHQPLKKATVKDAAGKEITRRVRNGPPIIGYFPEVIKEAQWLKVNDLLKARRDGPGRKGDRTTNLFSGLLTDAETEDKVLICWQARGRTGGR